MNSCCDAENLWCGAETTFRDAFGSLRGTLRKRRDIMAQGATQRHPDATLCATSVTSRGGAGRRRSALTAYESPGEQGGLCGAAIYRGNVTIPLFFATACAEDVTA
jgi:hypothetical protein